MATARIQVPPKLIPIFTKPADVRAAYGGRGSGKTRTFAKMTAIRAYMWDRAGAEGIILSARQFMNSLDDSSMEEIKAAIRDEPWLHGHFDIGEKYIRTQSRRIAYKFAGLDRNIDSIKSKSRIKLCWVDEAEPVTEEAWTKLIPTLREEDSELWVTWNPESKRSSTHKRFRESKDPRTLVTEINWRDNPWFPDVLNRTRLRDVEARPDKYAHIWEGDFATVFEGAYYVKELGQALAAGRITSVPYEPLLPVHTAWDLGKGANMAVWLFQIAPESIRVIDYVEGSPEDGIPDIVSKLTAKAYAYGDDWVPHDAKVAEIGTKRTRIETLQRLQRKPKLVPDHKVMDGINAVRETLPRVWIDAEKCELGLDCLRQYRSEYDENKLVFSDNPRHDWTSHAADAFRYLAMAWKTMTSRPKEEKPKGLEFVGNPDGTISRNIDVRTAIELAKKRKQARMNG